MSSKLSSIEFWLGVVIELIATVIQNIGMNLQKMAHHRQQMQIDRQAVGQQDTTKTPSYCKNVYWWIAIIIFLIGVVLDFVALALIPSTISLPVGSIGLAVSAICAHFWLYESFKATDFVGTLLIIAGAWFIVGFSNKELELLTINDINAKFTDPKDTPLWFFVAVVALLVIVIPLSYCWKNAITFALIPGLCGVFTILFGGCISQLTLNTLMGNVQMNRYEYYLIFLALVISLLILNNYLQRAISAYDNMIVTPIYFTTMLLISVLSGILFFKYFASISVVQGVMFGIGLFIIIFGCILLSVNHSHQNQINVTKYLKEREPFEVISDESYQNYNIAAYLNLTDAENAQNEPLQVVRQRQNVEDDGADNQHIVNK